MPLEIKDHTVQLPLVIVDSSVSLKKSTIKRESTVMNEIHSKIDNLSAEHIHYNERFHYYKIHILPEATSL